ncbi:MAG: transglycosylase domain-containing protein [Bacteroidaceae bacterium]|nr:transglycosylase domain-containing protein [Candidatus Minthousia equi]MCQ2245523.1 transglycosylase domain-containing protein [Bacteroidaceae bacterium]MDO4955468.1 transglycosylase domain-containing protein [Bacteroidales bacterium]
MKKVVIILWGAFAVLLLSVFFGFIAIYNGWIGYMPDVDELENPVNRYASQVFTSDGKLMGTWSLSRDNRVFVGYEDLPSSLVDALVATEDVRFYEHSGVDVRALGRAIVKRGFMGNSNAGGGSTITQQLAKQLYSERTHGFFARLLQKPVEWVISIKLERFYTKQEILTMYLNYFDFLNNAVGIKTAAQVYFNKHPLELTVEESATLVGMCKNPSMFNPLRYPERCKERRNVVLDQMNKAGYLSDADCEMYKAKELVTNFHSPSHKEGIAPYFREYLRKIMMAKEPVRSDYASWQEVNYYEDSLAWKEDPLYGWCNKNRKKNGENYNIYTDGLKIYTTIDSRMQRYAEEACFEHVAKYLQPAFFREKKGRATAPYTRNLKKEEVDAILKRSMRQSDRWRTMKEAGYSEEEIIKSFDEKQRMRIFTYKGEIDTTMTPMDSLRYIKHFLRCGFVSLEAKTGHVKAYVGGTDFEHFTYDMAGVGRRQVGSTIKPFLYSLAMQDGFTPCSIVPCEHISYGGWSPRGSAAGMVSLLWGLQHSNNLVSAYLIDHLRPQRFVELLHRYGIRNNQIHADYPLCLGTPDIKVMEMVAAYTAFANHGIRTSPVYVTRIEDSDGQVLVDFQSQQQEVISAESSYRMIQMMRAVIDGGTGSRIRGHYGLHCDMGGKTGTTNGNSDGWFIGYTPTLVNGAWVGGEDRDIHFDGMFYGQGAAMGLPIWALYMKKVFGDASLGYNPNDKFDIPEGFSFCGEEGLFSGSESNTDDSGIDDIFN